MKYKNPYYRKIKRSFKMLVSCGFCKEELVIYQKLGRGGLLRMHLDRIIESNLDLEQDERGLRCPNCQELIASRSYLKREKKLVYNMIRSSYNTSILDGR